MLRRHTRPSAESPKTVVCWSGLASDQPVHGVIVRRGAELRSDDPVVRLYPHCFVPSATPAREWPLDREDWRLRFGS